MPTWFLKASIKISSATELQEVDEVFEILCSNSSHGYDLKNEKLVYRQE